MKKTFLNRDSKVEKYIEWHKDFNIKSKESLVYKFSKTLYGTSFENKDLLNFNIWDKRFRRNPLHLDI